ncbi:MAG TPA: ATP-dependent helicase, partial [Candidatus Xenobia bacterium]
MCRLGLRLTPQGRLLLDSSGEGPELDARAAERVGEAFAGGAGAGLMRLGAGEVGQALPPVFRWWRDFAVRYVEALCLQASDEVAAPSDTDLAALALTAPVMTGAEYLTADVLRSLWAELAAAFSAALRAARTDLQSFLKGLNPAWNLVGRVHFNLAENRRDP